MKKLMTTLVLSATLAFSNFANAGLITLSDELKTEITTNGTYFEQVISDVFSVDFWLMDNFALVTHNYENISFLGYQSFADGVTNAEVANFYVADSTFTAFRPETNSSVLQTFQRVGFLDVVYELPTNMAFTGVDFISKMPFADYLVANNDFSNIMTYESIGVLAFQDASTIGGDPTTDVPEPSSLALFGLALLGMGGIASKRKKVS